MSVPSPPGPAGPSKPTRPLGTSKPPAKAPSPTPTNPGPALRPGAAPAPAPAAKPRRTAGTVPGIARTASSLRQGQQSSSNPLSLAPGGSSGNPLASLPAHLRNLSAPRIPSPLGKGTPARTAKQNLPVRTSKTTERHVFLPEDPQLAPMPQSPLGSQVGLAGLGGGTQGQGPPGRGATFASRDRERREGSGQAGGGDERSDAEKMTKREREEARLPRLTAYTTAETYRLKFLQAFLKREHGVGVVRVFDDCVYAVYNLPLLPGYGASTKIRSSPAVKSPGGVSLLERMTAAEDLGYDDAYFPADEDAERDPHISADDPSEYILSHSPPSPIAHLALGSVAEEMDSDMGRDHSGDSHGHGHGHGHEHEGGQREREAQNAAVQALRERERGEADEPASEPELTEDLEAVPLLTEHHVEDQPHPELSPRARARELGTHMSPSHPGYLEHVPAPALSPADLPDPVPRRAHGVGSVGAERLEGEIDEAVGRPGALVRAQSYPEPEVEGLLDPVEVEQAEQGLGLGLLHDQPVSASAPAAATTSTSPPTALGLGGRHVRISPDAIASSRRRDADRGDDGSVDSVPPPRYIRAQTMPVPVGSGDGQARMVPRHRRRKSHSTHNQVAEAVFFAYGVSVFFGFQPEEEKMVMEDIEAAGCWVRGAEEGDWEVEEFHYVYDGDAEYPRIYNDMFTFKSHSHLFKLSLAHAIAQSTKLSIYESTMQESLALTSSFPKELSMTGHLDLDRRDALKITGRLWKLRMDVNLIGGILDTPELFWSEASLFPLYEAIREYLEIGPRVQVLNDRLSVAGDLLEIIHEYIEERANHRITWIIIWLIVIACVVEAGEVVARIIFHNLPRPEGELLLVRGAKAVLGAGLRTGSGTA